MSKKIDVGSRLGPFEIVSVLGKGGAGAVYVARNSESGDEVALKVLHADHELAEEIERRFVREISVAQSIHSPYTVEYYDCGLGEDGVLYYTMERVEWGSLKQVLKSRQKLPWRDAAECGVQIAHGLAAMHKQDVIHRDLKPDNIFLSDDGRLKLGDFGLVRSLGAERLTLDGTTVGTAKYLAPEQAKAGDIDGRTDLYALGCNLFELLAGQPPFTADSSTLGYVQLMKQHVETPAPDVRQFAPSCPDALAELVAKLLAKDPDDRPQSAEEVAETLQAILDREESSTATDDDGSSDGPPESLTERLRTDDTVEAPEVNVKGLIVVAVVVVGGVAAYLVFGRG